MELFTESEYQAAKQKTLLNCECDICHHKFQKTKVLIYHSRRVGRYLSCSKKCQQHLANKTKGVEGKIEVTCATCSKRVFRSPSELKKVNRSFCCHSCAATFNNKLKKSELRCDNCSKLYSVTPSKKRQKLENIHSFCTNNCRQEFHLKHKKYKPAIKSIPFLRNCKFCNSPFLAKNRHYLFCCEKCKLEARETYHKVCPHCFKDFKSSERDAKFCSCSCRSLALDLRKFAHSNKGFSRSKIELFIEERLTKEFPELTIIFNDRSLIGGEIDIFLPELKLAFELNGVVHYEPIYGTQTLDKTQNRDKQKLIKCYEAGVELAVINLGRGRFTTKYADKIYSYVRDIIFQNKDRKICDGIPR